MSKITLPLIIAILISLISSPAEAQWPTTVRENLPVSASPDTLEKYPYAFPYPDGSMIVVLKRGYVGNGYQIVDRYGYLHYLEPQSLWPAVNSGYTDHLRVIPDGRGGVLACWMNLVPNLEEGIFAQRVDSMGNICWGDSAKKIYPVSEPDYSIFPDDNGGFYFALSYMPEGVLMDDIWLQHIDSDGNPSWPDSGLVVCSSQYEERYPRLAQDGEGGVFMVWEDWRPPHNYWGALYMQRFDSEGNPLFWNPEGIFICDHVWFHQIIPDGENGFLLHTNPNASELNSVYRFGPNGLNLWVQEGVSRRPEAKIVPGETGFFYLGFSWVDYTLEYGIYGQRMDLEGNVYWPTGSQIGALMATFESYGIWRHDFAYRHPYFLGVFSYNDPQNINFYLYAQSLDTLGNRLLGEAGTLLTLIETENNFEYLRSVPDDLGGVSAVWQSYPASDVWAKHVNADGTLGGPVSVAPPPVQHKPLGPVLYSSGQSIRFQVASAGEVKLELFDLLGRRVAILEEGFYTPGNHSIKFNKDDFASGIYLLRLKTAMEAQAIKISVVR